MPKSNDVNHLCDGWIVNYGPNQDGNKIYWSCKWTADSSYHSCSAPINAYIGSQCWSVNGVTVWSKPSYNLCKQWSVTDGVIYYQSSKTYVWSCKKDWIIWFPECSAKKQ